MIGKVLKDTYRIERLIGNGAMGAVYEASHLRLPRRFAVKLLSPALAREPEVLTRFRQEAEVTGGLGHPHIVEVIDFDRTAEGEPFQIMELLEGEDLAQRLKRVGKLEVPQAASILRQAASALAAAHRKDIVHRDLKPQNLFLCRRGKRDDFVKVLDFGISKVLGADTGLTSGRALIGTPVYMSPEQARQRADEVDLRTDVYAMGAIVFEMLTGAPLFAAGTVPQLLYKVVHGEAPALCTLRPDLRELEQVVSRATAKSRDGRFATMQAFWDAFREAVAIDVNDEILLLPATEDRETDWIRPTRPTPVEARGQAATVGGTVPTVAEGASPSKPIHFGRYQLIERIAVGGMAEIFKAKSFGAHGFEKTLVVKRILPQLAEDPEFVDMFINEARLMVRLTHPKVVQVLDFGQLSAQYFIAMEYVDGIDVQALLRLCERNRCRPPTAIAVHIIVDVLDALDYAHGLRDEHGKKLGIVHRDISPSNIFISDLGEVKLGDFGVARARTRRLRTQTGVLKGKYGYMSPEMVGGAAVDHRSDLFSVGVVLVELLMLRRLFMAGGELEVLLQVRDARLDRLDEHGRDIPPDLRRILDRALARDPHQRYQDAASFRDALLGFLFDQKQLIRPNDVRGFLQHLRDLEEAASGARRPSSEGADPSPVAALRRAAAISKTLVADVLAERTPVDSSTFAGEPTERHGLMAEFVRRCAYRLDSLSGAFGEPASVELVLRRAAVALQEWAGEAKLIGLDDVAATAILLKDAACVWGAGAAGRRAHKLIEWTTRLAEASALEPEVNPELPVLLRALQAEIEVATGIRRTGPQPRVQPSEPIVEGSQRRILIFDDSPIVRDALTMELEQRGHEVAQAETSADFERLLASFRPELIFLDINLPGIKGDEVCRRLKQRADTRSTPVILLSGLPDDSLETLAERSGADGFLSKQHGMEELIRYLDSLLSQIVF